MYYKTYIFFKVSLITMIILSFISSNAISDNYNFRIGSVHTGSLNNMYDQKMNFVLPEGEWEITDNVELEFYDQVYQEVSLFRIDANIGGWLYIVVPKSKSTGGMRWTGGGMKKCDGIKKKHIIAFSVSRGGTESVSCLSKFIDDEDYEYVHLNVEARSNNGPLSWVYYDLYYNFDNFDDGVHDFELERTLDEIVKGMKSGFKGNNPTQMSAMNNLFIN